MANRTPPAVQTQLERLGRLLDGRARLRGVFSAAEVLQMNPPPVQGDLYARQNTNGSTTATLTISDKAPRRVVTWAATLREA